MSKPKLITKMICLVSAVLSKHRNSDPEHIHRFLGLSPSRFLLAAGCTLYPQRAWGTSFLSYRSLPTVGQIKPKVCFEVLARAENRSDDPGCIHRLLSCSLFFGLRDRLRLAPTALFTINDRWAPHWFHGRTLIVLVVSYLT
jgi:hypothetical protein